MFAALVCAPVIVGCQDLSRFSTNGAARYEGTISSAAFIRSGFTDGTSACLTIDSNHLQDTPGEISTSDGRFSHTPLRPIPEFFNDPLSTFNFGEGRVKNLIYVATPIFDIGDVTDVFVVVSLLQSNDVEVRVLRGAPQTAASAATSSASGTTTTSTPTGTATESRIFGVFALSRQDGSCAY